MSQYSLDNDLLDANVPTYATFGVRLGASLLDGLIVSTPLSLLIMYGLFNGSLLFIGIAILLMVFYKVLMEGLFGATLGKMIVGIRVVNGDMSQVSLEQSVRKNMIYVIQNGLSWWSFGYIQDHLDLSDEGNDILDLMTGLQTITDNPYDMASQFISFLILVSCMAMLFDQKKRQTLHDRLADTYCIVK